MVVEKSWIIYRRISWFLQISLGDSYAVSVKKERLFPQSKELRQETRSFYLIAPQHRSLRDRKLKADNPLVLSTLRYIGNLVFFESFNWRHNKYSDRFLLEERGDRSRALLDILWIFRSQLVTGRRHRYLRKTYLLLSADLFEMSLS